MCAILISAKTLIEGFEKSSLVARELFLVGNIQLKNIPHHSKPKMPSLLKISSTP